MQLLLLARCLGLASALQLAAEEGLNQTASESLGGGNLCLMGRFAPKFFLLGTPKSGTTSFFADFARSRGIVTYKPGPSEPAWHAKEPWVFGNGFDTRRMKTAWLDHYPKCQQSKHRVAVDCTPGYFGDEVTPFALRKVYRPQQNLVFMVFLREPLARSHSHYWHYRANGVLNGAFASCKPEHFPPTFQRAVDLRLESKFMCNCSCDNIFGDSMYADSFRRYFKNFHSSMFHVVLFKHAVQREVVEYAWNILHVHPGSGAMASFAEGGNRMNHHVYPTLVEELSYSSLVRFDSFMNMMAGPYAVGRELANSSAKLYGFGDEERSTPAIAEWLDRNW